MYARVRTKGIRVLLADNDFPRFIKRSGFLAEGVVFALWWASAGTALMAVGCAVRRKLAYVSTV